MVSASGVGRITEFNPEAERTFGYRADEVLGESFLVLLVERCHSVYLLELDRLLSAEDAKNAGRTVQAVGRRKSGEEFPLELCLVTWRSSEEALYTAIVRDISDRKRIEREREELLLKAEAIARTDELTGLPNRRSWDEELRREIARARRSGEPLSLVLLDIDNFKRFNDEHGHQAGDALLRDAAIAWRMHVRVTDFLARYGGEEFALLLPACPPPKALAIIERLRSALPGAETCSAGVAYWDSDEDADEFFARADRALYEAKRAGRDRVVTAR